MRCVLEYLKDQEWLLSCPFCKTKFEYQIMTEEAFDVMVIGSCMTDLVSRWVRVGASGSGTPSTTKVATDVDIPVRIREEWKEESSREALASFGERLGEPIAIIRMTCKLIALLQAAQNENYAANRVFGWDADGLLTYPLSPSPHPPPPSPVAGHYQGLETSMLGERQSVKAAWQRCH
ncbi:ribokinase isoform X1 [Lates japonicus]|uniref:Ribokinase isoform X1 n=1 Tax=Lates japonicus TaxID=270547 RepID=A0AAD3MM46_LATJO|nr:ribokinase isoform X1 [Lates japonicus]